MISKRKHLREEEKEVYKKITDELAKKGCLSAELLWDEQQNAVKEATTFFLAKQNGDFQGMGTLFFPSETEAELSVGVLSGENGRETLEKLVDAAKKECEKFQIAKLHLICNPKTAGVLTNWLPKGAKAEYSEFLLEHTLPLPIAYGEADCRVSEGEVVKYRFMRENKEVGRCFVCLFSEGKTAYLYGLETKKSARKSGVATGLLGFVSTDLLKRKCKKILLQVYSENLPAMALYRKLGFCTSEQRDFYQIESGGEKS